MAWWAALHNACGAFVVVVVVINFANKSNSIFYKNSGIILQL